MNIQAFMYSGITDIDGVIFGENNTTLILYKQAKDSYVVPDGVVSIAPDAFRGRKELKNITMPDSLKHIGEDVFRDCENLTGVVLPNGIEAVDCGAFWDCKNLTSVIIPDSIQYIGEQAFSGCEALQSVVFQGRTYHTTIRESYRGYETRDLPQAFYDAVNNGEAAK